MCDAASTVNVAVVAISDDISRECLERVRFFQNIFYLKI